MARFYGSVKGDRGEATRLGGSGLTTVAASWQGAVKTSLYKVGDKDHARVELVHWRGAGVEKVLYEGPVDGPVGKKPRK